MIIFSEQDHQYTHLESRNKLVGWTKLISNFSKVFDRENQLTLSAYKVLLGDEKYNNIVKSEFGKLYDLNTKEVSSYLNSVVTEDVSHIRNEISFEWDYSNILGSKFHKEQENLSYERGYEINPFTEERFNTVALLREYDNQSAHDCLIDLEDGFYPELLAWDYSMDQSKTFVTQIDKCFIETIDGIRYVDIDDIKTNKKRPYKSSKDYLKAPLNSISDSTEDKYKLQVMFGAKLMETHGFTPRYCAFTHYLNYDINKSKLYPTKYDSSIMDSFQLAWKDLSNVYYNN
jgi:hypothetical protein